MKSKCKNGADHIYRYDHTYYFPMFPDPKLKEREPWPLKDMTLAEVEAVEDLPPRLMSGKEIYYCIGCHQPKSEIVKEN